tara:strand:+ start:302 stop:463 length:162 start_codon:yes stop_codon:yes gene_type:complete
MIEHLGKYFLFYGAFIVVILTWITETNWFWRMIGLEKKKDTKKLHNRNWYGHK